MAAIPTREMLVQMNAFRMRCRKAGLSLTHQREIIYRSLLETRDHPSPEEIYGRVRRKIPSISLGTVYKNIKTFIDSGLLRELSLHHGTLRLETNPVAHHHLVCRRCKAIVDVEDSAIGPVRLLRRPARSFRIENYSVEFHGLCQTCADS